MSVRDCTFCVLVSLGLLLRAPIVAVAFDCGDLDASGQIAASDALRLLKKSVGLSVDVACPSMCSTTSTTTVVTDECFEDKDCVGNPNGPHCCTNQCSECDVSEQCDKGAVCESCACKLAQ